MLGACFIKWPDNDQQAIISDNIEAKLDLHLCIGSGDGSHITQTEEPHQFGYLYRNRKHRFLVRAIVVFSLVHIDSIPITG